VQLAFDSADRLVELVEERHGAVAADEAARHLFALRQAPEGLARSLLDDVVRGDARLRWRGGAVALAAAPGEEVPLEQAIFVVVDLETTGLSPGRSRICEIGAVRVRALEIDLEFQTLVNPGERLPSLITSLTGIADADVRGAPRPATAVRSFLSFAGDAVLVAHNARFDVAFLDHEVERLTGRRVAASVLDTVALARRLLAGRVSRTSLARLSSLFGTSVEPCHRALPDAQATAEVLIGLIGIAQERGARTVGDLLALAAPRTRRVYAKRVLAFGAPSRPGVYLFRDRHDSVLYVGRARDLQARLRSYFRTDRQRPSVEAALGAVERIEWRVLGSELEAALEELRLIRELRPPANARSKPGGAVYLRRRGDSVVVSSTPSEWGPLRGKTRVARAARALDHATDDELAALLRGGPLPRLRRRMADLSECLRFEDAARLRDRIRALEQVVRTLAELDRMRRARLALVVPAAETGFARAFVVAHGRVIATRAFPRDSGGRREIETVLAMLERSDRGALLAPEDAEELQLAAGFVRRPPPELRVVRLAAGGLRAAA
jgi:DNA polymerase III epsilon subunit family exonuclease